MKLKFGSKRARQDHAGKINDVDFGLTRAVGAHSLYQGPSGELNTPGYSSVIHSLAWWGYYKDLSSDVSAAEKLRAYQTSGKPLCPPF